MVGAPDKKDAHLLYVWSRVWGKLERILEGPKEGILDVAAHPTNSTLLSVSSTGRVWAALEAQHCLSHPDAGVLVVHGVQGQLERVCP